LKRVLCISPHFPPVNAPDMQRLRQSLRYLHEFGWEPVVFAVDPRFVEASCDPLLLETVPHDVEVHRVRAFHAKLTRKLGLGNLGFRSWLQYQRAVDRYLATNPVDLIYFSTTVFTLMALGRHWRRKFGVPFVIDLQDPWRNDYYLNRPRRERPRKFWFDYLQKRVLEARTVPHAAGVTAVSASYLETLANRYARFDRARGHVLTFGFEPDDYRIAERARGDGLIEKTADTIDLVFTGVVPPAMRRAISILFEAIAGSPMREIIGKRVRLHFVGTQYAVSDTRTVIDELIDKYGVTNVIERRRRIGQFALLNLIGKADGLLLFGLDSADYSPSKLGMYLHSGKPILAVLHEESAALAALAQSRAAACVGYGEPGSDAGAVGRCRAWLERVVQHGLPGIQANDALLPETSAREKTRSLADFFDRTLSRGDLG
jgi:hypothetical protein